MAGARLAEEIRRRDPRLEITMVGAERHPAYNRVLLSSVVAGSLTPTDVRLPEAAGIDLRLDTLATGIDRAARRLRLVDGSTVDYDVLVLATGSRAWVPPTDGLLTDDGEL